MSIQNYPKEESMERLYRLFRGDTLSQAPGSLTGQQFSSDEALSRLAQLLQGDIAGETAQLPASISVSGGTELAANGNIVFDGVGGQDGYYADLGDALDNLQDGKTLYLINTFDHTDSQGYGDVGPSGVSYRSSVISLTGQVANFVGDTRWVLGRGDYYNLNFRPTTLTASSMIFQSTNGFNNFYNCYFDANVYGFGTQTAHSSVNYFYGCTFNGIQENGLFGGYYLGCKIDFIILQTIPQTNSPYLIGCDIGTLIINSATNNGRIINNNIDTLTISTNPAAGTIIKGNTVAANSCANVWTPTAVDFCHNTFKTAIDVDITVPANSYNVVP